MNIVPHIAKGSRYTIGLRIENKFLDLLETSYKAYFSQKEEKVKLISECIFNLDIIKFLTLTAWEGKLIGNKQFETISLNIDEIGRMLGGWKKSLGLKKNRLEKPGGKENTF